MNSAKDGSLFCKLAASRTSRSASYWSAGVLLASTATLIWLGPVANGTPPIEIRAESRVPDVAPRVTDSGIETESNSLMERLTVRATPNQPMRLTDEPEPAAWAGPPAPMGP